MGKILIIDDDPAVYALLGDALKKEGYEVFISIESKDSFDQIIKNKPDLILLDIVMPGLDGLKVLEEIKKRYLAPDVPIIILSSFFEKDSMEIAMNMGAQDYWLKGDFSIDMLVKKIKNIIQKGR